MRHVHRWSDRTSVLGYVGCSSPKGSYGEVRPGLATPMHIDIDQWLPHYDVKIRGLATAHMPRNPASSTAQLPGSGIFGVSDSLTHV